MGGKDRGEYRRAHVKKLGFPDVELIMTESWLLVEVCVEEIVVAVVGQPPVHGRRLNAAHYKKIVRQVFS